MRSNGYAKLALGVLGLFLISFAAAQGPTWALPEWLKPAIERVNAIPNVDARLAALQQSLDAAKDKTSLSATTARYTLEILKDVKAHPDLYGPRHATPPPRASNGR